jgi:hypothetical protein
LKNHFISHSVLFEKKLPVRSPLWAQRWVLGQVADEPQVMENK